MKTSTWRSLLPGVVALLAGGLLVSLAAERPAVGEGQGGVRKENLDLPSESFGSQEEEERAPEIIVFYGQVYEADSFFFCLDRSLSMADGEWQILKRELTRNIRQFSEDVQFGMAFFARETTVFPGDKKPATATKANKAAAIAQVDGLQPESWTCLLGGLRSVFELANRSTTRRRAVILMSDGKPTCPGTDFVTYRKQILEEAVVLNPNRIPIHTIGIGFDVDDSFLRVLSEQSGGTYRRISR